MAALTTRAPTRTRSETPLVRGAVAAGRATDAAKAATGWTVAALRTMALSLLAAALIGWGLWQFYQWNQAGRILAPALAGLLLLGLDAVTAPPDAGPDG